MKCINIRDGKECGGELTKLKNYYVCTECCSDTITFEDIIKTKREAIGALSERPKQTSIELLHPDVSGYYTYKITYQTEYFIHYVLYGKDNKVIGTLQTDDYTDAKWMIGYKGPRNVFFYHRDGTSTGKTLQDGEIKFYKETN